MVPLALDEATPFLMHGFPDGWRNAALRLIKKDLASIVRIVDRIDIWRVQGFAAFAEPANCPERVRSGDIAHHAQQSISPICAKAATFIAAHADHSLAHFGQGHRL